MFKVLINATAESDIQSAADWWKQNRSAQQAEHWYDGIYTAIKTLSENPERCSPAAENELRKKFANYILASQKNNPSHSFLCGRTFGCHHSCATHSTSYKIALALFNPATMVL